MTVTIPTDDSRAADSFLQPLMDYVISATGLMYYADRRREFAAHVTTRLQALEIDDCHGYLQFIQTGPSGNEELDRLITLLTIGETHFFRHRELFQALEKTVFPSLIEKNRTHRRLRIWSAGCSIGAEAYSLSMLLRRRFADYLSHWDVQIIGTDINRDFLARASAGIFEDWALRAVSPEDRDAYFSHDGKRWSVKEAFREGVSFAYHNLASSQFSSPLGERAACDLVLCRNVMIYFSQDVVRQAIRNLHTCLATDGWLVVGHAEHNMNWFRSFRTLMSSGAVIYQKPAPQLDVIGPRAEWGFDLGDFARTTHGFYRSPELGENTSNSFATASDLCLSHCDANDAAANCDEHPRLMAEADSPQSHLSHSAADGLRAEPRGERRKKFGSLPLSATLQEIRSLADRGEMEEALEHCRTLQRFNALDPSPHFYQALILQQRNDDAGAEQSLRRAIYLDRNHLLAHYYLGLLLQKQQQIARAARSFHNVIKLSSERSPDEQIAHADALTVADLKTLSAAQLSVLEKK